MRSTKGPTYIALTAGGLIQVGLCTEQGQVDYTNMSAELG
jgi:hypothetical protein